LEKELDSNHLKYFHIEKLGGRRSEKRNGNIASGKIEKGYNNYAWTNNSFRAYACYMITRIHGGG
jgi:hypothetical protein